MRTLKKLTLALVAMVLFSTTTSTKLSAQEWSTGLDIYSSYIWRGAKFGSGPAFQPYVDFSAGGLSVGAWGSVNSSMDEGLEMDLYAGYSFDFGLGIAVTDYYFGGDWTEFELNHYIEPMVSYEIEGFSILGAYMLLPGTEDDPDTPEDESSDFASDGDTYIEAAYSFDVVSIALGVGDGQYTDDGEFNLCNITVGTSKEITITESFALPVSGSVTLNPATGGFFITAGISL